MQHFSHSIKVCTRPKRSTNLGFTLIEIMVAVAIVAILTAIALPSYQQYIRRGQLVDGQNLLSAGRANMERYYQDNRTYVSVSGANPAPCDQANVAVALRTLNNFVMTCTMTATPPGYLLTATGSGPVLGVTYTVDANGVQGTGTFPAGWTGWGAAPAACWITKQGQTC
jgi:prepilin-type N-terminal cleavage/methylation domain-containing protein